MKECELKKALEGDLIELPSFYVEDESRSYAETILNDYISRLIIQKNEKGFLFHLAISLKKDFSLTGGFQSFYMSLTNIQICTINYYEVFFYPYCDSSIDYSIKISNVETITYDKIPTSF